MQRSHQKSLSAPLSSYLAISAQELSEKHAGSDTEDVILEGASAVFLGLMNEWMFQAGSRKHDALDVARACANFADWRKTLGPCTPTDRVSLTDELIEAHDSFIRHWNVVQGEKKSHDAAFKARTLKGSGPG